VELLDVAVVGETPKLPGWALLAVLDHDGPETVTRRIPGVEDDLSRYRNAAPHCDHCGTTRRRIETFVLKHEDGRLTQVGRDCLADFLGGQSPQLILWLAGWVREIGEYSDEDFRGLRGRELVEPLRFLARSAACVRLDGWCSRTRAREGYGEATADNAWRVCFPPPHPNEKEFRWLDARRGTDADLALATEALAWAQALEADDPSEYLANLGRTLRKEVLRDRDAGLAASAIQAYLRFKGDAAERERAKASTHYGEVGTRYRGVELTLLGVKAFDSERFGTRTLVTFVTAEGCRLKWWTSPNDFDTREPGWTGRCDFTVKRHELYKGVPETTISRLAESGPQKPRFSRAKARAAAKAAAPAPVPAPAPAPAPAPDAYGAAICRELAAQRSWGDFGRHVLEAWADALDEVKRPLTGGDDEEFFARHRQLLSERWDYELNQPRQPEPAAQEVQ
jgi:hypothetical protein